MKIKIWIQSLIFCILPTTFFSCQKSDSNQNHRYNSNQDETESKSSDNATAHNPNPEEYKPHKCTNITNELVVDSKSTVTWTSIKKEIIPVIGHQKISGVMTIPNSDIEHANMKLYFDITELNSFDELRDYRIKRYIYGFDTEIINSILPEVSFEMTSISSEDSESVLPDKGYTRPFIVNGVLLLAGKKNEIEIPINFTRTDDGFTVSESQSGFSLSLEEDLHLSREFSALMSLVPNVTADDKLVLNFDIKLHDMCLHEHADL